MQDGLIGIGWVAAAPSMPTFANACAMRSGWSLPASHPSITNPAVRFVGGIGLDGDRVLTGEIEDRFWIRLYDIDAEILATYGSLLTSVTEFVSDRARMAVTTHR